MKEKNHKLIGGMVNDNHQQGIERKKQRKGDMEVGQEASMAGGWRHEKHKEAKIPKKG